MHSNLAIFVAEAPILAYPNLRPRDMVHAGFDYTMKLSMSGFGAVLEQREPATWVCWSDRLPQPHQSSGGTNLTPLELEAGAFIWSIRSLGEILILPSF